MLVIISDLHLTDGSSGETIRESAFRSFRQRLRDLAYDASWRDTGDPKNPRYQPIERFDILLLGDVLDVIRSGEWPTVKPTSRSYVRPWHADSKAPAMRKLFEETVTRINKGILINNKNSLAVLRGLVDKSNPVTLPPAEDGQPAHVGHSPKAEGRLPVDVRIHYMVGNHDWFYHLEGPTYDKIRRSVVKEIGLANSAKEPFPHDPYESETIRQILQDHLVFARHGDIYDAFNFEETRDASSIGDAIVVDLLNRFPAEVEGELKDVLPEATRLGLKELDNVRPLPLIPNWIDGLLNRTCPDSSVKRKVKQIWNKLADEFIKSDFIKDRDTWRPNELVDKLQAILKFSTLMSMNTIGKLASGASDLLEETDYSKFAQTEPSFKNRRARFIVYGHTHHYEIVPLDSSYTDQGRFDQIYFNSGTWRRVHEQTVFDPSEKEFADWDVMTYLAFFRGDERKGRSFESWSGAMCPEC